MTADGKRPERRGINTRLAQAGNDPFEHHGFLSPPVVRASTVLFPTAEAMATHDQRYTYGTRGTPATDALEAAIDDLEGAAGTILVPSGLAAVTIAFLACLHTGDHLLVVDTVYGPVRHFCDTMLARLGIETEYYDPALGDGIEALFRPNTRLVHIETPGSNTFEMQDIPAIAAAAKRHGVSVSMDNTWATPLFFRPLDVGVDISIQASTKYPAGHSDILMGSVSANEAHWPAVKAAEGALGVCGTPEESYQVLRGMRTMGVRLERHQASAVAVARWLAGRPEVVRVLHPALEDFPGHDVWKRDFGGSSGVFSFVLAAPDGDHDRLAFAFLNALSLFRLGYSWGGYSSLALRVDLSDRTIAEAPEGGPLIRLKVGLENVEDLFADLERHLAATGT